jgi:hypothetical protein
MLHSMHVVAHLGFGLAPHIQLLHTQRNVTGKAASTYPVDTLESGLCNPLIFPEFLHDANLGLLHTRTTTHLPHIPLLASVRAHSRSQPRRRLHCSATKKTLHKPNKTKLLQIFL